IFNGEVYNHEVLRAELVRDGQAPSFRGHSDTEVILACIEAWGVARAVTRFVGMFAIALWDRQEQALTLVRDRAGVKPLYYAATPEALLFASELKAFAVHPQFKKEIDRGAVALYSMLGYVPAPWTIYHNVRKLAPGSMLTLSERGARSHLETYWSAVSVAERVAGTFAGTEGEALDELERLVDDSVRLRMIADVPLGVFLSGGVDSTVVAALMQRASSSPVKTFTIGFEGSAFDEAPAAAAIARHLGTEHTESYVGTRDLLETIPLMPSIYDEPFADTSQVPTYLVSKMARRSVTVSLSGDGGDELFGGYHRYFLGRRLWSRTRRVPKAMRGMAGRALRGVPRGAWEGVAAHSPLARLRGNLAERMAGFSAALLARDPAEVYRSGVMRQSLVPDVEIPPITLTTPGSWPTLEDPTELQMHLDFVTYLVDDILVKVDRASMAASLEAREPLLDHRLVEFAWSLPLAFKVGEEGGKRLLRALQQRLLPAALLHQEKKGFALPIAGWLRGPLRDWAEPLLSEHRLQADGFFDVATVRRAWSEHLAGRDESARLWTVLMFNAWL
ncbi:MAG: asparagine synthase (glutamine-hydrolyzing), partial [Acidobacteria bacterium]|nr:asparagine synthase (glutamine-hydrolyzing) [Acidobacteriota bacterium]